MKYRVGFSLLILFLLPQIVFGACSPNGFTVVYINGVFANNIKDAEDDTRALEYEFSQHPGPSGVDFITGYNPTHGGGVGDLIESASQKINLPISNYDRDNILRQIHPQITARKILLVGHSQGTFYTNEIYNYLIKGGYPKEAVGVYNIATPASFVAGDGAHLTYKNDKIINRVPGALKANIPILPAPEWPADPYYGHFFSEVYLKYAPDRIVSDIGNALRKLDAKEEVPNTADTGCFIPPKLTIPDKIGSGILIVTDPVTDAMVHVTIIEPAKVISATYNGTVIATQAAVKATKIATGVVVDNYKALYEIGKGNVSSWVNSSGQKEDAIATPQTSVQISQPADATPNNSNWQEQLRQIEEAKKKAEQAGRINTTILRHTISCDRHLGSLPFPFVSLEWSVDQNKTIASQILYRNGNTLVKLPASGGHSYFDGIIKAGETYSYVVRLDYKDRPSESAKAEITIPADICGLTNSVQNEPHTLSYSKKEGYKSYLVNFPIATNPGDIAKRLGNSGYSVTTSEIEELAAFVFLELTKEPLGVSRLQKFGWYLDSTIDSDLPAGLCAPNHSSCAKPELPVLYRSTVTGYSTFTTVMHEIGHLYAFAIIDRQSASSMSDVREAGALSEGLAILFENASAKLLEERFQEPTYYTNFHNCNKDEALHIHLKNIWEGQKEGEHHDRGEFWVWSIVLMDQDNPVYKILNADKPDYLTASQRIELYRYIIKMPISKLENTRNAINEDLYAKVQKIVKDRPLNESRRFGPFGPGICGDFNFLMSP